MLILRHFEKYSGSVSRAKWGKKIWTWENMASKARLINLRKGRHKKIPQHDLICQNSLTNSQKSRLISSQYTQINSIQLHESSISINWFKILLMDWKNHRQWWSNWTRGFAFPLWSMLISVCNLRFTAPPPNPKLNESPRVAAWVWILF